MTAEQMPFDVALRRAVAARGLTLDRLAERLAMAGAAVSVSTLSNWQRGRTIPATPSSRHAVAELERILDLAEGTLMAGLAPYATTDRKLPTRTGLTPAVSRRLRARFGLADPGLVILKMDDLVRVEGSRYELETKLVVRAERPGIDRMVTIRKPGEEAADPVIKAGPTCRVGRVKAGDAGLFAVELIFDAPLTRGELYPLSYRGTEVESVEDRGGYHGTWTKAGLTSYEIMIDFGAAAPSQVYRVWRTDPHTPHTRVSDLRLIGGRFVHLWLTDPPAGFHGIRWEG